MQAQRCPANDSGHACDQAVTSTVCRTAVALAERTARLSAPRAPWALSNKVSGGGHSAVAQWQSRCKTLIASHNLSFALNPHQSRYQQFSRRALESSSASTRSNVQPRSQPELSAGEWVTWANNIADTVHGRLAKSRLTRFRYALSMPGRFDRNQIGNRIALAADRFSCANRPPEQATRIRKLTIWSILTI